MPQESRKHKHTSLIHTSVLAQDSVLRVCKKKKKIKPVKKFATASLKWFPRVEKRERTKGRGHRNNTQTPSVSCQIKLPCCEKQPLVEGG